MLWIVIRLPDRASIMQGLLCELFQSGLKVGLGTAWYRMAMVLILIIQQRALLWSSCPLGVAGQLWTVAHVELGDKGNRAHYTCLGLSTSDYICVYSIVYLRYTTKLYR